MAFSIAILLAFTTSLLGCCFITRSHTLRKLVDVEPTEHRWHQTTTPGFGGIPLFAGLVLAVLAIGHADTLVYVILICCVPLIVLGTWDDVKPLSPSTKLMIQVGTALLFKTMLVIMHVSHDPSQTYTTLSSPTTWAHWAMCCIWLVAIINAINLLDNMDGLAGGIALIACLTIGHLASFNDALAGLSPLYYCLAASLAGFLVFNRHPAKLFMGDSGALWLGFIVAAGLVLVVLSPTGNQHAADLVQTSDLVRKSGLIDSSASTYTQSIAHFTSTWLLALLICAVPVCDTLMVMITRRRRGQAISIGGKDHLSHRMVKLGLSEKASVRVLHAAALLAALMAVVSYREPSTISILASLCFFLVFGIGIVWLTICTPIAANGAAKH